jgi:hypothetical protein
MTGLRVVTATLGAPSIALEQTDKNNISFGNTAGVAGNHSYWILLNNI